MIFDQNVNDLLVERGRGERGKDSLVEDLEHLKRVAKIFLLEGITSPHREEFSIDNTPGKRSFKSMIRTFSIKVSKALMCVQ